MGIYDRDYMKRWKETPPPGLTFLRSQPRWLIGLLGLLLGIAIGFFILPRWVQPPHQQAAPQVTKPAVPGKGKPSAKHPTGTSTPTAGQGR
jgi:hypothetical protein